MKSMSEIQDEITAICYQYGIELADAVALALSAYISHEIMNARQDVFNMVIDSLDKKGVK